MKCRYCGTPAKKVAVSRYRTIGVKIESKWSKPDHNMAEYRCPRGHLTIKKTLV